MASRIATRFTKTAARNLGQDWIHKITPWKKNVHLQSADADGVLVVLIVWSQSCQWQANTLQPTGHYNCFLSFTFFQVQCPQRSSLTVAIAVKCPLHWNVFGPRSDSYACPRGKVVSLGNSKYKTMDNEKTMVKHSATPCTAHATKRHRKHLPPISSKTQQQLITNTCRNIHGWDCISITSFPQN